MVMRDRNREPEILGFSEAITRDPFFLIGKSPNPNFELNDLRNISFASVSEVPTPWMCLQEDLRKANIDPASLNRNPSRVRRHTKSSAEDTHSFSTTQSSSAAKTLATVSAKPIAATMRKTASSAGYELGLLAAAGTLTIIPGAIVIYFVRNYIAKGFAMERV